MSLNDNFNRISSNDRTTTTTTTSGFRFLPSSSSQTSAADTSDDEGCLAVTILSVYDLPTTTHPKAVTLHVCGTTVSTGPPVAKHKDRNSFRFSSGSNSPSATGGSHILKVYKDFPRLYRSEATIRLLYDDPNMTLETTFQINDHLPIHQASWQILNFKRVGEGTANGRSSGTTNVESLASIDPTSSWQDDTPPTLRAKLYLDGPYRPEIGTLLAIAKGWFDLVDLLEDQIRTMIGTMPKMPDMPRILNMQLPDKKYILIPAIPIITATVVTSPVLAGLLLIGMPFFLPILVSIVFLMGCSLTASVIVYSSTRHGRDNVGGMLAPLLDTMLSSKVGQSLVYNMGPRPTPLSIARFILPTATWQKLITSLLIDLIGSSSYLLPVAGEVLDLAWAPTQFILVMAMYDSTAPNLKYLSLAEELLPFTDLIPSATIGWMAEFGPNLLGNKSENPTTYHSVPTSAS